MRLIVCGGRDYHDVEAITQVLDWLHATYGVTAITQGGANGADMHAANWGWDRKIPVGTFNADWNTYGRAAGSIRNQCMLDESRPDGVVAFPGGRGTADMVGRARRAGVPVYEPQVRTPPMTDKAPVNRTGISRIIVA